MIDHLPPVFIVMGVIAAVCEIILTVGFVKKFPVIGAALLTVSIIMGVNVLVYGGTS